MSSSPVTNTVCNFDRWSPDALAAIGRLDLIAREILDGIQLGLHRSIRCGFSSEFFDYKTYQPGDDALRIDWRLYARTGKFFVKRFEAETNLESMILLDSSPSMKWKWRDTVSKYEYASMLAASLALLFSRQHDMAGLFTFGSLPVRSLPPRSSPRQAEMFIALLGRADSAPDSAAVPSFADSARGISSVMPHRGLVVVISDFELSPAEMSEGVALLRAKGDEVLVFHLLDRAEIELPFDGITHVRDSETGMVVPFPAREMRAGQAARVESFRSSVRSAVEDAGAVYIPLDTALSPVAAILRMNECRKGAVIS